MALGSAARTILLGGKGCMATRSDPLRSGGADLVAGLAHLCAVHLQDTDHALQKIRVASSRLGHGARFNA